MAKKAQTKEEKSNPDKSNSNNETKKRVPVIKGYWNDENLITESSDPARDLYERSRFGAMINDGKVQLSMVEGYYLLEKGKLDIRTKAGRAMKKETLLKRASKLDPNFWTRYCVFRNIRDRGYIIKTALKFGADFRVYDRGVKPGEDHARWIVYPVNEATAMTWYEFAAKNRVAHSTKKRLLIGIVDNEGDVTYYEIRWVRP